MAVAIVAAFLYAVHRLRITPRSVWSDSPVELGVADIARSVIDWTKVVVAGLVGGGAATIVGLVVIVIAVDAVIGSLARERKLDTLSGLADRTA